MPQPPGLSGFSNLFCTAPVGRPAGVGGASGRWRPQAPDEATLARNVDAWTRTHGSAPPWATFVDARWSEANETLDEANVLLAAGAHPDAEVVIVIGAGNGAILEAIEMQSPSACAVVLEPDAAAAVAWLSRRDWSDRIAASRLLALTGPAYAGAALLGKRYGSLAQAPVIVHPWLLQHRPDDVARARQALRQVTFESDANAQARRALAARYLLQTLGNAPRIAREGNAAALAGLFPGMPAVVVAAGPSLDRNIHDLAVVKDRAIVIACDTAARPLTSVGVEPDLIVASDPSRANA
ncbi:MAG TPA: 6-hydroxymethylpterin diphosphokinase MptE-like protein, partial [Vicinamibacterales bacterium]|nr:6-hydroxymethylpterin diphosphokinase MptE-like protein [Vicinamibacterales bacterium]